MNFGDDSLFGLDFNMDNKVDFMDDIFFLNIMGMEEEEHRREDVDNDENEE